MQLDSKIPEGPLTEKWEKHKFNVKLVNPANKRKYDIIVVGTGLAGASAAAALAELGYNVKAFTYHDSPRRAHSIAAQGGINAAKNYQNDGDSVFRLFYDTIKGGDYRAREANVYRLAQVSVNIIDQCVAQGVPFAREYGGLLANRSFGGAQVSRTFYARGQTGQQLLLGAYSALSRQIAYGKVKMYTRSEMLDLVVVDGQARGIVTRHLVTGEVESHAAHHRLAGFHADIQRHSKRGADVVGCSHDNLHVADNGPNLKNPAGRAPPFLHHKSHVVQASAYGSVPGKLSGTRIYYKNGRRTQHPRGVAIISDLHRRSAGGHGRVVGHSVVGAPHGLRDIGQGNRLAGRAPNAAGYLLAVNQTKNQRVTVCIGCCGVV
jgi:hypothetical protein